MIGVLDYGVGNVKAFLDAYKRLHISAMRVTSQDDVALAQKLILPGVGHFDHAMSAFDKSGLRSRVEKSVFECHTPILGVCVGMQILARNSEEGSSEGLGWIPGAVRSFRENVMSENLPMPHMGWNNVRSTSQNSLFAQETDELSQFYFLHSYYFEADDRRHVLAQAYYGFDFDVIVGRDNVFGVQCHPEKSHQWGAKLLKNFAVMD